MQLVGRSTDYTSDDPTLNPPLNESQPNPMRRDTVQVPSGESVTLRVVADNPGDWDEVGGTHNGRTRRRGCPRGRGA